VTTTTTTTNDIPAQFFLSSSRQFLLAQLIEAVMCLLIRIEGHTPATIMDTSTHALVEVVIVVVVSVVVVVVVVVTTANVNPPPPRTTTSTSTILLLLLLLLLLLPLLLPLPLLLTGSMWPYQGQYPPSPQEFPKWPPYFPFSTSSPRRHPRHLTSIYYYDYDW